jgi:hypothetical protein
MRWPLFDFLWGLIERALVSLTCWGLGMHRDATQWADARKAALARA